ncbi:MAG: hypothetical protein ABR604_09035 [Jatrophihabitantaceae bacterium]
MLATYHAAFRAPGSAAFCAAGFIMRFSIAVYPLGLILLISTRTGHQRQRSTEPPAHELGTPRQPSALRYRGMPLLVFAAVGMGAVFASAEVTMVAFCGQHGSTALAGVTLACLALGSGVSGFGYGSRTRGGDVLDRFRRSALVFAVLPLLFLAAVNVAVLAVLGFVVGLGIAPTLIMSFSLLDRVVPGGAMTEGMAWLTTGLSIGYGVAAALVGRMADAYGARMAFTVTIAAGLLVGALALALHAQLRERAAESRAAVVG